MAEAPECGGDPHSCGPIRHAPVRKPPEWPLLSAWSGRHRRTRGTGGRSRGDAPGSSSPGSECAPRATVVQSRSGDTPGTCLTPGSTLGRTSTKAMAWTRPPGWGCFSGSPASSPARTTRTPSSTLRFPCCWPSTTWLRPWSSARRPRAPASPRLLGQDLAPTDLAGLVGPAEPGRSVDCPVPAAWAEQGVTRVTCRRLAGHVGVLVLGRGGSLGHGRRRRCARAGPGHPRHRSRARAVAGRPPRPHRTGEQRAAAGQHGGLRLAHRHRHQHLVQPAVPDLRPRAAVLQPQLREVPLADPPRRPGAHLRAAPARVRHR